MFEDKCVTGTFNRRPPSQGSRPSPPRAQEVRFPGMLSYYLLPMHSNGFRAKTLTICPPFPYPRYPHEQAWLYQGHHVLLPAVPVMAPMNMMPLHMLHSVLLFPNTVLCLMTLSLVCASKVPMRHMPKNIGIKAACHACTHLEVCVLAYAVHKHIDVVITHFAWFWLAPLPATERLIMLRTIGQSDNARQTLRGTSIKEHLDSLQAAPCICALPTSPTMTYNTRNSLSSGKCASSFTLIFLRYCRTMPSPSDRSASCSGCRALVPRRVLRLAG